MRGKHERITYQVSIAEQGSSTIGIHGITHRGVEKTQRSDSCRKIHERKHFPVINQEFC